MGAFLVALQVKVTVFSCLCIPLFRPKILYFSNTWLTLITNKESILVPSSSVFCFLTLCVRLNTSFSCSLNYQTRDTCIYQLDTFALQRYICKFLLLFSLTDSMSFISDSVCTQPRFRNVGFIDNLDSSQQKQFAVQV